MYVISFQRETKAYQVHWTRYPTTVWFLYYKKLIFLNFVFRNYHAIGKHCPQETQRNRSWYTIHWVSCGFIRRINGSYNP